MSWNNYICRACVRQLSKRQASRISKRRYHDRWLQHKIAADWEWAERAVQVQQGKQKSMVQMLDERGFIHQVAGGKEELDRLMTVKRVGAYVGVDPTAPSLHVGHMVPFMALFWMYLQGYASTTLLGGSTAQYGDPSGRTTARDPLDPVDRKNNMAMMHKQMAAIWMHVEELGTKYGYQKHRYWRRALLNNNVWLNKVSVHEVFKYMGGGLRMGSLLSRDSVKSRMESKDGMSIAEFCYPMLQAWDWWHMYSSNKIQIQIGGSDQFGNIITGIEGVKHVAKTHPHQDVRIPPEEEDWEPMGFTVPLLTTSTGEKFGKSAGNAVWLHPDMTTPFDLYAYFLSTTDADVERLLRLLTFLPLEKIAQVMAEHNPAPEKRIAQHLLAQEFLELAHGPKVATQTAEEHRTRSTQRTTISVQDAFAKAAAEAKNSLKAGANPKLNYQSRMLNKYAPNATANNTHTEKVELDEDFLLHATYPAVLQAVGLVNSRSEGQRLISNRGAYVAKLKDDLADHLHWFPIKSTVVGGCHKHVVWSGPDSSRGLLVLRVGKWNVKMVHIVREKLPVPVEEQSTAKSSTREDSFQKLGGMAHGPNKDFKVSQSSVL